MRKTGIALTVMAAVLLVGCEGGNEGKPLGPADPIPGPAGAVAPNGNIVPQGRSPAPATVSVAPGSGTGSRTSTGTAAESKMPPEGSGSGKSVQEASAHGATKSTEEKSARK